MQFSRAEPFHAGLVWTATLASISLFVGTNHAAATCAEDVTRLQIALSSAAPDVRIRTERQIAEAQERAKRGDQQACNEITASALKDVGLPRLAPLRLSTPMAGGEDRKTAGAPSKPASDARASPDPRNAAGQATAQTTAPAQAAAPSQTPASSNTASPQQQAGAAPSAGSQSNPVQQAPSYITSRELLGVEVRDRDNAAHIVGRVGNLIIDRNSGRVEYVVLQWGGFLGWDRNRVIVPYNLLAFGGRWDFPSLRVPAGKIANAPQIRESDLDKLLNDPDWRRAVVQYFGAGAADESGNMTPGAPPSGPQASAAPGQGQVAAGVATGHASHANANPGEGAADPTAAGGTPAAAATGGSASASADRGPDIAGGRATAQKFCAACHTFDQNGTTRVGPNLFGVGARPVASVSGYNYSAALKSHHGAWTPEMLNTFLKDPKGFAPGTYMTFAGVRSERERANLVAYLESLNPGGGGQ